MGKENEVTATGVLDAYPLAAMQAGMLSVNSDEESSARYQDLFTLTIRGEFDRAALVAAIGETVAMQPILRTSFDIVNLDEPAQLVHADATVPVDVHDWRGRDPGHRGTCPDEPLVQRTGVILHDWIDRVLAAA